MSQSGEDIFIYRVVAFDKDEGRNAEIKYVLKYPRKTPTIRVDSSSGKIYSTATLLAGQSIELQVQLLMFIVIEKKNKKQKKKNRKKGEERKRKKRHTKG